MSQGRPALSVNVNVPGPKSRNVNGKAAIQARASAQAPSSQGAGSKRVQPNDIKAGQMISEQDLMARSGGGFSDDDDDDEEPQDSYTSSDGGRGGLIARGSAANGSSQIAAYTTVQKGQMMQEDGPHYIEEEESEGEDYREGDVDMGSEDEEGIYDEDEEDELSSSPSIPDENIDFDLVYALHNFIATVEGQATVNKGNNLTLLDDSNSYWWLVRVLRTQEVGYIPAENIETPFERLARLNKHRNVDLTSATDDDHMQVPEKIYTSHLVKQRSFGVKGVSSHSGKLSALSLRNQGPSPLQHKVYKKRGVQFGPPTYLEHSGNELSEDEEYNDEEEYDDEEEEGEEGEAEERGEVGEEYEDDEMDNTDVGPMNETRIHQRKVVIDDKTDNIGAESQGQSQQQRKQKSGAVQNIIQPQYLNQMEPDDGMDWDEHEAEKVQRAQQERNAAKNAAEQRRAQDEVQRKQMIQQVVEQAQQQMSTQQQQQQPQQPQQPQTQRQSQQQAQQQSIQQLQQAKAQQSRQMQNKKEQQQQQQQQARVLSPDRITRPQQDRQASLDRQLMGLSYDRSSIGQAARERSSSDASSQHTIQSNSIGRVSPSASPDGKKDKRGGNRKNKIDEDLNEEKQSKKRSGVFSGLFSRSKEKKDRKGSGSTIASNHQRGGSNDADSIRSSEDSSIRRSVVTSNNVMGPLQQSQQQPIGLGRVVQERDRAVQEAYQRQFLQDYRRDQGEIATRPTRPGSLIGTPSTVPMLNVLRVFAGNDIESDATFKTVLLNETTTAHDLVRQAMQRFRLGNGHSLADYVMSVKLVEGNERILNANEKPLQVFDHLTAAHATNNRNAPMIPRVKRSSVGSISSISSNLSLNPAIARLGNDFSDDHDVKFYLNRKTTITHDLSMDQTMASAAATNGSFADMSQYESSQSILTTTNDSSAEYANSRSPQGSTDTHETIQTNNVAKFALRLLIFPSDLPEGMIFDPQTNALIPEKALAERGPNGIIPGEGVEQNYREKILALPRNTTVAEVIEQGLDRFGIMEGVVEGGDNVEERTSRRKSKGRIRYGLCIGSNKGEILGERSLAPTGRILDAYQSPPIFRAAPPFRRGIIGEGRRRSQDSAMLLSLADEISPADPIFILRQIHNHKSKSARALSPTEDILAQKQDQKRQAERGSVGATPSEFAMEEARLTTLATAAAAADPHPIQFKTQKEDAKSMSRQDIITAQRVAAQERRAAVMGAQRNDEQGVDVVLQDQTRIRSSKATDSNRIQYSYIPPEGKGQERDISNIVEDVFKDQKISSTPSNASLLLPPRFGSRMDSATTLDDYESARASPMDRNSPLSLREVHLTDTAPLQVGSKNNGRNIGASDNNVQQLSSTESDDILDSFVRNPNTTESTIEDRIDQVLSRVGGEHQSSSSRDTISPISGSILTHQSGTSTTTPISATMTASGSNAARNTNRNVTDNARVAQTMLPLASGDFGLDNLYAIVDAASRRKPNTSPKKKWQQQSTLSNDDFNAFTPVIAGLFAPPSPHIADRRVKEAYAPIGKHLNGLEDSLDQILNDVLHRF